MWLNILNALLLSDFRVPNKRIKKSSYSWTLQTLSQIVHLSRVSPSDSCLCLPRLPFVLWMSTQLFPWLKKADTTLVCDDCSHPALVAWLHGRPGYVPNMCVVTQGHSGRLTGPFLKSPCVAVVHLPEVAPAMEFFLLFLFMIRQPTSCFKLRYFLLAGGDSPYNI